MRGKWGGEHPSSDRGQRCCPQPSPCLADSWTDHPPTQPLDHIPTPNPHQVHELCCLAHQPIRTASLPRRLSNLCKSSLSEFSKDLCTGWYACMHVCMSVCVCVWVCEH